MRTWEIQDTNAIPSDLVREQDFILHVRRMQRQGAPYLVANFVLNASPAMTKNRTILEGVQQQLTEFAKVTQGIYAEMSNGDVFVSWEESATTQPLPQKIASAIFADTKGGDMAKFLLLYHMPKDYTPLRERTNHYIEVARSAATLIDEASAAQALKSEAARGALTPWSVDQIGKLLGEIDLRRYGRTQPMYRQDADGQWKAFCEEYFISFEDLRRERFPKLDLITPEHLFLALCEMLDQRLLTILTEHRETITGRAVHLNLSVRTIMSGLFVQFARSIPHDKRGLIGFELHRGDLFQDFTLTLSAIDVLHREGFKVAIDSVTPDMVDYINLAAFPVDYIKVNVSKDRADQLDNPAVRGGLARIPAEKLIFFRCDNESALAAGQALGVRQFQGWLIDDVAQAKPGS
ncbi:MAG: EAL domain-containing protein [Alphaproteobacteria bacterium]|nr:EAL domain-containing protein [Alphaproteobacteria bacterium]